MDFVDVGDFDSLASVKPVEMQIMVEYYVMHLKKETMPTPLPFQLLQSMPSLTRTD